MKQELSSKNAENSSKQRATRLRSYSYVKPNVTTDASHAHSLNKKSCPMSGLTRC
jgi:hypothetical protein